MLREQETEKVDCTCEKIRLHVVIMKWFADKTRKLTSLEQSKSVMAALGNLKKSAIKWLNYLIFDSEYDRIKSK